MADKILRVAVLNNYGFTKKENKALEPYEKDWQIFVNANSFKKIDNKYPSVITVNPHLTRFVKPKGDLGNVKAVRIKYASGAKKAVAAAFSESVEWADRNKIPILVTYMRFTSRKQLDKYVKDPKNYKWKRNYYRQVSKDRGKALGVHVKDTRIHYCDIKDKGCPECRNCAKLTYGINTDEIYGINLSASGFCKQNCPSCYAQKLIMKNKGRLSFDKIIQNAKQKGKN